jgi:hypothetical protein
MKPRAPINTPAKCQAAREYLGLNKFELARVMRLGSSAKIGAETVRRIEQAQGPTGPYQLALEALVAGWRPRGVTLPIDKEA